MNSGYVHPLALVESREIGAGTRVFAFTHVQAGAVVGADCSIGDHCFIEAGARLGSGCTIKNGVSIWDGIVLGDGVFVGPGVVFTNDRWPRSRRLPEASHRYEDDGWRVETLVRRGASIGAGAVVLPGVTIGAHALVGAGAVVTADVAARTCVIGSPARAVGMVCECGLPAEAQPDGCRPLMENDRQDVVGQNVMGQNVMGGS